MRSFLLRQLPWLAGFLLAVNLYLAPHLATSPRATDLAGLLLGCWILWRLARGRQAIGPLVILALAALLPAGWTVASLLDGDGATLPQAARWLVAVPWGAALVLWLDGDDRRRRFAWGLVWGGVVNVGVILLQTLGLESYLRLVGLSSSTSAYHHYFYQTVRLPGLHGHHNSSSAVVSLLVPATLYLYFRHRSSLLVPLGGLFATLLVLHLTSTRGPLVAAAVTIAYAFVAARAVGRGAIIAAVLLAVLVPVITIYGPPGGWSRWRDTQAIEANAGERLDGIRSAAGLSLDHPLGLGVTRGKETLYDHSGIRATHNAFLQASLFLGLPLGLAVTIGLPILAFFGLGGRNGPHFLAGLLACHTIGLFLFEEHLNNPTFVILTAWFLVTAAQALGGRQRAALQTPALP